MLKIFIKISIYILKIFFDEKFLLKNYVYNDIFINLINFLIYKIFIIFYKF